MSGEGPGTATCGTCGRTFPDIYPGARCPYEYDHEPVETVQVMVVEIWRSERLQTRGDFALTLKGVGELLDRTEPGVDPLPIEIRDPAGVKVGNVRWVESE